MRCSSSLNPIGIEKADFSWKIFSQERNVYQRSYRIIVAADENLEYVVWDSGEIFSGISINIAYNGKTLEACKRYYWSVEITAENGEKCSGDTAWFETGLMSGDLSAWRGAQWIGAPGEAVNTAGLKNYRISGVFKTDSIIEFAAAARNKDNYVGFKIEHKRVYVHEYSDNAWNGEYDCYKKNAPYVRVLGNKDGYELPDGIELERYNRLVLSIKHRLVNLEINGINIINEELMPDNIGNQPRKTGMFLFGIRQDKGCSQFKEIKVEDISDNVEKCLLYDNFLRDGGAASMLGTVSDGVLTIADEFNLISAVPSLNVRHIFECKRKIRQARLYASARGFYNVYVNGKKAGNGFYNPGFTDYRKRIQYQIYDIGSILHEGYNAISAIVTKGYYTGYVGYSLEPMVYGIKNSFIAMMIIEYDDDSCETIVTGDDWQYTYKGPVIDADYLDGESYDARAEYDVLDLYDERWNKCEIVPNPENVQATNGRIENERFEFSAQYGPEAEVERILKPIGMRETPKGHFVYDLGQNMTGTVRLRFKGKRGLSLKIRYGEMCYNSGELYLQNLRTAANTDVYTLNGSCFGECFVPEFTSHGFRYVEITGDGFGLTKELAEKVMLSVEGLVITNTREITGGFECSNEKINKLQSNIQWGQRGNSLLVFTDCPQRNERIGWTGDAQVFAATAAYNMNVRAFMDKWLLDLRDAQKLYNKNRAVPDTAPLGGDNRPAGCAGWGDAAVIVPWKMYIAYGDEKILRDNYEMMEAWIEYQSRSDRQNCGIRTVDGKEAAEQSDMSSEPFIQVQQSRGDHLAYDRSTPFILSATAYAAHVSDIMARICRVLDKPDKEKYYRERFENIKKAFNEAWVCSDGSIEYWGEMSISDRDDNGNIINKTYYSEKNPNSHPSQTAYALAIDFGLIPEKLMKNTALFFKRSIDERCGCLSVGFLGISHLAPALEKAGLTDIAYKLLKNEKNPGWLYSVINGATTIWERWNSYVAETGEFGNALMNSFNHYSYGAIGEWLFSSILGINSSEKNGETGYRRIILKPVFSSELAWARGWHESPCGKIKSNWSIEGNCITYECSIPANTSAMMILPDVQIKCVMGKNYIKSAKTDADDKKRFELLSGNYKFIFGEQNNV